MRFKSNDVLPFDEPCTIELPSTHRPIMQDKSSLGNVDDNVARLLFETVIFVAELDQLPEAFERYEWNDAYTSLEVEVTGWGKLANFIATGMKSRGYSAAYFQGEEGKKYGKLERLSKRFSPALLRLKDIGLAVILDSKKIKKSGPKLTRFRLENLPGTDLVAPCLEEFDKCYKRANKSKQETEKRPSQEIKQNEELVEKNAHASQYKNIFFDIPYQQNSFFTGRKSLLEQLHKQLNQETVTAITQVQAISGLGGIGKTQTAVEYAYRYKQHYSYVFWVNADTQSNLTTDFANLANQLVLPIAQGTQEEKIPAVRAWLAHNNNWLLIFDNVDTPSLLPPIIPSNPKGKILVTSRAKSFVQIGIKKPIALDVMSTEEGIEFLINRTDCEEIDTEREAASELTHELGGLPLALEQAGAYIYHREKTVQWYLKHYRKQGVALLEKYKPETGRYDKSSVLRTWAINFEAVEAENPASTELLKFSAFLAPDDIPYDILIKGASHLGQTLREYLQAEDDEEALMAVEDLIDPLSRYSLVRWEIPRRCYSLHRMVQAVVRDGIDRATKVQWIESAMEALIAAYPGNGFMHWDMCAKLLPHCFRTIEQAEQIAIKSETLGQILSGISNYLNSQGRYGEAEPLYQESLVLHKQLFGDLHPTVATSLYNLAVLYHNQGRYNESAPLHQEVLTMRQQLLDEAHPDIANSLNSLASLYKDQGYYSEAESFYQEALRLRKQLLGDAHPNVANSFNSLASLYYAQGRYSEAESLYQESLALYKQLLGDIHPDVAGVLNNLASLYHNQGCYDKAKLFYQEVLSMQKHLLGDLHPSVANSLSNLATLYLAQGCYGKAEPLFQEALTLRKRFLGDAHPNVAITLNNLAAVYKKQGRYSEAESLYQEVLMLRKQVLGDAHPDVAHTLNNLATLHLTQGRYSKAESFLQESLMLSKQVLDATHPDVITSLNNLAAVYERQDRYSEAESLYQEVLMLRKQVLGDAHPDVAGTLNNLAVLYHSQGRYSEAESLYQEALILNKQVLGDAHPDVVTSLDNLAMLYESQGRYSEAELLYQEVLILNKQVLGDAHPDVVTSLNNLAMLYHKQGRYSEAESLYQEALGLCKQVLGDAHPNVATYLNNLALLCKAQGRYSEAESLYQEVLTLRKQVLGDSHPDVATSLNNLATLYYNQSKYSDAEPLYRDALTLRKQVLGDSHPDVATSLNNLAGVYKKQDRYSDAKPLFQEALALSQQLLGHEHSSTKLIQANLQKLQEQKKL
ncbi:tetratricopeptide repeat protein [Leptothoe sp. LEGE 181152]|nr:tetratricopeptide repeat protein [Leptothoe sp. LEGE 181152]